MKTVILALSIAVAAFAQGGASVNQVADPPPTPVVQHFLYDASNALAFVCYSPQRGDTNTWTRAASTITSVAVATNVGTVTTSTAHGLYVGARVTISGATVGAGLNAAYTIRTVPSTTTYTITTAAVADATYTDAGLVITTTYPLLTAAKWAVKVLPLNASSLLDGSLWLGASTGYGQICSSAATY